MRRLLRVLGLWCLFSCAGLVAIVSVAWALAIVGANVLITPFLVLGLASVLPVSLAVADNSVTRPDRLAWPYGSCPHCCVPSGLVPGQKPDPGLWPFV